MQRALLRPTMLTLIATVVCIVACGGGGSQSSGNSPTSPVSSASIAYNVFLVNLPNSGPTLAGQVSVDADGKVTVKLTDSAANTTFSVQFCPAPAQHYACFVVGSVSSDAGGKANAPMRFPASGSWAGDFQLLANGMVQYATDVLSGPKASMYMASLQPQATANGKGVVLFGSTPPQAPLDNGNMTLANGVMQVTLTGALPNTFYGGGECPLCFGSNCYTLVDSKLNSGFGDITTAVEPFGRPTGTRNLSAL